MPASYQSAVARMFALGHELTNTPSHKFNLEHMRVLLAALEHPEKKFRSVLIAGTNGKGSTAATLASILRASGLRTALYTSPHLLRINERIQINREEIPDDNFALVHDMVARTAERLIEDGELPWHPSFFEMLTAIAFEYFATSKIDVAVLEVGMGGRLDATNVVDPLLSVITDIALDHQKFLGNTIAEIAREKAGIIGRKGTVITLPQTPEANDVIGHAVLEANATAISAVPFMPPVSPASPDFLTRTQRDNPVSRYPLQVLGQPITIETPLVGRHQLRNVALAIAAAEQLAATFPITPASIERGIRETRWPGRFQVIPACQDAPEVVFDVAHNPAGAWALRSTLSCLYEDRRLMFVFGAMNDKSIREIAEILFPLAEHVIATRAENPRSATADEICEAASRTHAEIETSPDVQSALHAACALAGADDVVVVTGSIYVVGEAMQALGVRR
jgi:dihydrofolate synthase / folylpolyglutamate synthase